jgi:hypothetical protein
MAEDSGFGEITNPINILNPINIDLNALKVIDVHSPVCHLAGGLVWQLMGWWGER